MHNISVNNRHHIFGAQFRQSLGSASVEKFWLDLKLKLEELAGATNRGRITAVGKERLFTWFSNYVQSLTASELQNLLESPRGDSEPTVKRFIEVLAQRTGFTAGRGGMPESHKKLLLILYLLSELNNGNSLPAPADVASCFGRYLSAIAPNVTPSQKEAIIKYAIKGYQPAAAGFRLNYHGRPLINLQLQKASPAYVIFRTATPSTESSQAFIYSMSLQTQLIIYHGYGQAAASPIEQTVNQAVDLGVANNLDERDEPHSLYECDVRNQSFIAENDELSKHNEASEYNEPSEYSEVKPNLDNLVALRFNVLKLHSQFAGLSMSSLEKKYPREYQQESTLVGECYSAAQALEVKDNYNPATQRNELSGGAFYHFDQSVKAANGENVRRQHDQVNAAYQKYALLYQALATKLAAVQDSSAPHSMVMSNNACSATLESAPRNSFNSASPDLSQVIVSQRLAIKDLERQTFEVQQLVSLQATYREQIRGWDIELDKLRHLRYQVSLQLRASQAELAGLETSLRESIIQLPTLRSYCLANRDLSMSDLLLELANDTSIVGVPALDSVDLQQDLQQFKILTQKCKDISSVLSEQTDDISSLEYQERLGIELLDQLLR